MCIQKLAVSGLLSFGPDTEPLRLEPLNVLVGPNGSGKSNLISVLSVLQAAPTNIGRAIRDGAHRGVQEWVWKGGPDSEFGISVNVASPERDELISHVLVMTDVASRLVIANETILEHRDKSNPQVVYEMTYKNPPSAFIKRTRGPLRKLAGVDISSDQSILSQIKDPEKYPVLAALSKAYESIRIYREWSFGRSSVFRAPQSADGRGDRLAEDFSNLGLFLNRLRGKPKAKKQIIEHLRDLYEGLDDFDARIDGGFVWVELTEGDFTIPASRLSDGTLRYLCLLAILCDPDPPGLICIEEPELGLHPDMLPKIADLLKQASKRTQLIVTTHSDILVDAMTDTPESVVVMEKHDGKTVARRLENDAELQGYLERYRLGELWLRGHIGGTRW